VSLWRREPGLRLRFDELQGAARRVVLLLIPVGVSVTMVGVGAAGQAADRARVGSSVVIRAILVVSGPTVVLPLLAFVRPTDTVRTIRKWEGV
jgi:NhaP-type Na+/H+ or K+/H+ antiporter